MNIKGRCSRRFYPAAHNSGRRPLSAIKWVVIHSIEAPTAESAARWFQNPDSGGSAQLCVDDENCFRCLDERDIPWAAPGANEKGTHIELAGFARWTKEEWLAHERTLRRAAYKTAVSLKARNIPARWRSSWGLRLGLRGVTSHANVSKAFGGSDHWDPGPGFPRKFFMALVRQYLEEMA